MNNVLFANSSSWSNPCPARIDSSPMGYMYGTAAVSRLLKTGTTEGRAVISHQIASRVQGRTCKPLARLWHLNTVYSAGTILRSGHFSIHIKMSM